MNDNELHHALDFVSRELPQHGIACLVVGGFAVNHHGYTRATLDLDFMIEAGCDETLKKLMLAEGYGIVMQPLRIERGL